MLVMPLVGGMPSPRNTGTNIYIYIHTSISCTGFSFNPVMVYQERLQELQVDQKAGRVQQDEAQTWGDGTLFVEGRTTKEERLELCFSNKRTLDPAEVPDVFCWQTWISCCL